MIRVRVIEIEAEVSTTVEQTPTVAAYLHGLAHACLEAASNPRVRPLLFALLPRAPRTLCELRRAERIAA